MSGARQSIPIMVIGEQRLTPPEYERLAYRIVVSHGCDNPTAEAALNRVFAAARGSSSPWWLPHLMLDVLTTTLAGDPLEKALGLLESREFFHICEGAIAERRR